MTEPTSPEGQIDHPDVERPSDVTDVETPQNPEPEQQAEQAPAESTDSETRDEAPEGVEGEASSPTSILPEGATVDVDSESKDDDAK